MPTDPRADNTSATGGFLILSPVQGRTPVEDVLHDLIAGITGLAAELVRPRWQPDPPAQPKPEIDWCAFGITGRTPINLPEIIHSPDDGGFDTIIDHEQLDVLASFYGPRAEDLARMLRTGLYVPQNRETLRPSHLAFLRAGNILFLPEVAQNNWLARADLPLVFGHANSRTLAIRNLEQSTGFIDTDRAEQENLIVPIGCKGIK